MRIRRRYPSTFWEFRLFVYYVRVSLSISLYLFVRVRMRVSSLFGNRSSILNNWHRRRTDKGVRPDKKDIAITPYIRAWWLLLVNEPLLHLFLDSILVPEDTNYTLLLTSRWVTGYPILRTSGVSAFNGPEERISGVNFRSPSGHCHGWKRCRYLAARYIRRRRKTRRVSPGLLHQPKRFPRYQRTLRKIPTASLCPVSFITIIFG